MSDDTGDRGPVRMPPAAVVGPQLRKVLRFLLVLFALLTINSVWLATTTLLEWWRGVELQNVVYVGMFLAHLVLGLLIIVPVVAFGLLHARRAWRRPNRRAVRAGVGLFVAAIVLLVSGLLLMRGVPVLELKHPLAREWAYWLHLLTPLAVVWLFLLHRLAGPRINWRAGAITSLAAIGLTLAATVPTLLTPPPACTTGDAAGGRCEQPPDEARRFAPALAQTAGGELIPPERLMMDDYCADCHGDVHATWSVSAHRFASFNNPAYLFSVRGTREKMMARDGNPNGARFCAGCHDPVPLFAGLLDAADYDDANDPTAHAGITCSVCHGITEISSPRGNADFVIAAPAHYPFAGSEQPFLRFVNHLLVKAKPQFHKRTFLKPMHKTSEFCGTCHKVHLPQALNGYKWLRGQNHYDAFLLSGVSGHGIQSFYYPKQAVANCAKCHMPLQASADFGARPYADDGVLMVHDHQFPAANTALAHFFDLPPEVNAKHEKMLKSAMRVDVFALREGGTLEGVVRAPITGNEVVSPGKSYLVDIVLRTVGVGHPLTEGTIDSNEVWLEVEARAGNRIIGHSGSRNGDGGAVDASAHFINAYVLDRNGNRIDRRNAEDIFTRLYDHQIPPGAADVVHYRLDVPTDVAGPITVTARVNYRKFDTRYVRLFSGDPAATNTLPIVEMATASITLPTNAVAAPTPEVPAANAPAPAGVPAVPLWERWNDYGIAFLRKPNRAALRQAEHAFSQVEALGQGVGALHLARVYLSEGRIADAADALARMQADATVFPWSAAYYTALVDLENGQFDAAIEALSGLVGNRLEAARARGFDFSRDYRLLNQLAQAHFDRARQAPESPAAAADLRAAVANFEAALAIDPENVTAHYGLAQLFTRLGDVEASARHRSLHERYRADDNARDRAVAAARQRDPAANHAAEPVVIYPLVAPPTAVGQGAPAAAPGLLLPPTSAALPALALPAAAAR